MRPLGSWNASGDFCECLSPWVVTNHVSVCCSHQTWSSDSSVWSGLMEAGEGTETKIYESSRHKSFFSACGFSSFSTPSLCLSLFQYGPRETQHRQTHSREETEVSTEGNPQRH